MAKIEYLRKMGNLSTTLKEDFEVVKTRLGIKVTYKTFKGEGGDTDFIAYFKLKDYKIIDWNNYSQLKKFVYSTKYYRTFNI